MISVQISKVKIGECFHLIDDESSPLWVKSFFDRISKKFFLISCDDPHYGLFLKGNTIAYVENFDSLK